MHYISVSQSKNTSPHNIALPMWSGSLHGLHVTEGSRNRTLTGGGTTGDRIRVKMVGNSFDADGMLFSYDKGESHQLLESSVQSTFKPSDLKNYNLLSRQIVLSRNEIFACYKGRKMKIKRNCHI